MADQPGSTPRAGTIEGDAGKAQHVDLWRKVKLRRELLALALPGPVYVPFIGDGDIAVELYGDRFVFGCDLDEERVKVARSRLKQQDIRVADANGWPFAKMDTGAIAVADFDAYVDPYQGIAAFWAGAKTTDRVILFGTDGHRQTIMRRKLLPILGTGDHVPLGDKTSHGSGSGVDYREPHAFWWPRYVRPYLEKLLAPARIVGEQFYRRGPAMLYWGIVVERRAADDPAASDAQVAATLAPVRKSKTAKPGDTVGEVEKALLEAARAGNVQAAIFWLEHNGGPRYQKLTPIEMAREMSRPHGSRRR